MRQHIETIYLPECEWECEAVFHVTEDTDSRPRAYSVEEDVFTVYEATLKSLILPQGFMPKAEAEKWFGDLTEIEADVEARLNDPANPSGINPPFGLIAAE